MTEGLSSNQPDGPSIRNTSEEWLLTVASRVMELTEDLRRKSQDVLYRARPPSDDLKATEELIMQLMTYVEDEVLVRRAGTSEEFPAPLIALASGFQKLFESAQGALQALGTFDDAAQYYGDPDRCAKMSWEEYEKRLELLGGHRRKYVESLNSFRQLMIQLTTDLSPGQK